MRWPQLHSIPKQEVGTLFKTVLTNHDQNDLKNIIRDKTRNVDGEVEKMIEELAKTPLGNSVLRRTNAYEKAAKSDDFDQAKNQLDPLRVLVRNFPEEELKRELEHAVEDLDAALRRNKERKMTAEREAQEAIDRAEKEVDKKKDAEAKRLGKEADDDLGARAEEGREKVNKNDGCCVIS